MPPTNYSEYFNSLNTLEQKYAPKELYFQGDFSLLTQGRKVSIVGSRAATPNGLQNTSGIVKKLVQHGFTIVSGLAAGIDTCAHKSAIECGGKTIAVLGTPLSVAYPKNNFQLLEAIKSNHLAVSQFQEGSKVFKSNFPNRNRTMALISDATIIIEASENSGTQHQAWEALRLGRIVFLLESMVKKNINWVSEILKYGGIVLTKNGFESMIENIPYSTDPSFMESPDISTIR